jgi:hypothetical protein
VGINRDGLGTEVEKISCSEHEQEGVLKWERLHYECSRLAWSGKDGSSLGSRPLLPIVYKVECVYGPEAGRTVVTNSRIEPREQADGSGGAAATVTAATAASHAR